MNKEDLLKQASEEFKQLLERLGQNLGEKADSVAAYAAARADHLALTIGQPGYDQAVAAETQNVALQAGIAVVDGADQADLAKLQAIGTGLRFVARLITVAV